jgi:S-adenosylmethionine hydrolase
MNKRVVTFTSDLGKRDYYLAAVKSVFLNGGNSCEFVEIINEVSPFNVFEGAFNLRNSYSLFPDQTIHVFSVFSVSDSVSKHVLAMYNNHYFIGPNNGFLSLVLPEKPTWVKKIVGYEDEQNLLFPSKNIYANLAKKMIDGENIDNFLTVEEDFVELSVINPRVSEDEINGIVIYADSFGNIHSNIHKSLFEEVAKGRAFELRLRGTKEKITKIHPHYRKVNSTELMCFFNSTGYLEIAVRGEKVNKLFAIRLNDPIRIEFENSQELSSRNTFFS